LMVVRFGRLVHKDIKTEFVMVFKGVFGLPFYLQKI